MDPQKVNFYQQRDYCQFGSLQGLIKQGPNGRLPEKLAKFYAGEIVAFLETAHKKKKIMHLRLTTDNCLIYKNHHLKIANFMKAKYFEKTERNEIQGTTYVLPTKENGMHYIAPEFIEDFEEGPGMDLWALGCIIYEMVTGNKIFDDEDAQSIKDNILLRKYEWPPKDITISNDCYNLVSKLLLYQPELRLGAGEPGTPQAFKNLKEHAWFSGLGDLNTLYTMSVPLKFQP